MNSAVSSHTDPNEVFCAFHQNREDSAWCVTPTGRLARFTLYFDDERDTEKISCATSSSLFPDRVLFPRRPFDFPISLLQVNASEKSFLLAGYKDKLPFLSVGFLPDGVGTRGQFETYNYVSCQGDFIFNRRGITIQRMSWWYQQHDQYFVILAGNLLAIYDVHSVSVPCVTYRLNFSPIEMPSGIKDCGTATDFAFISFPKEWEAFSIVILRDDGGLFLLCPIVVPGMSYSKAFAQSLITEETKENVKNWHRTVFSRTQLQSGVPTEHVLTRCLNSTWKLVPALQGPINSLASGSEGPFTSLMSFDSDYFIIASPRGKIVLLSKDHVTPVLQEEITRSGPPHIHVLHPCYRVSTETRMQEFSQIHAPFDSAKRVELIHNNVASYIAATTPSCMMWIDYSELGAPTYSPFKNLEPCLGWITICDRFKILHAMPHFQLKCSNLHCNEHTYQSLVRDLEPFYQHGHVLQREVPTLGRVSELRRELKAAHRKILEICEDQERRLNRCSPEMGTLNQHLQRFLGQDDRKLGSIATQYDAQLQELCSQIQMMNPTSILGPDYLRGLVASFNTAAMNIS